MQRGGEYEDQLNEWASDSLTCSLRLFDPSGQGSGLYPPPVFMVRSKAAVFGGLGCNGFMMCLLYDSSYHFQFLIDVLDFPGSLKYFTIMEWASDFIIEACHCHLNVLVTFLG